MLLSLQFIEPDSWGSADQNFLVPKSFANIKVRTYLHCSIAVTGCCTRAKRQPNASC